MFSNMDLLVDHDTVWDCLWEPADLDPYDWHRLNDSAASPESP